MKIKKSFLNPEQLFQILKREWIILSGFKSVKKKSLKELGVSFLDVNFLLNTLEWQYQVEIKEGEVSPQTTLEDFMLRVVNNP